MATGRSSWTVESFQQANPKGQGQDDVPALLRRVADTLDAMGDIDVLDIVLHDQMNEHGSWYSLAVYFAVKQGQETGNHVVAPVSDHLPSVP